MKIKTYKIFSLCNDFSEDEMYEELSNERGCDCYIEYTANSAEKLALQGYSDDRIASHLITLGAEEDEKVLIHIDY